MRQTDNRANEIRRVVPIGRRIGEVLEGKGDAFSIRSFALRIKMNREKLRTIITGERPALPSELEVIASGLNVSVERLRQLDTLDDEQKLDALLKARQNLHVALDLAIRLNQKAIGMSEKCMSLNNLGRIYFLLQRYSEAHSVWTNAFQHAQNIHRKYGEIEILDLVTYNLMMSYTMRNDYSQLTSLLKDVESTFTCDPIRSGVIYYTKSRVAKNNHNLAEAKANAYLSLQSFIESGDRFQIGKAEINVAHYEYFEGNYSRTMEMLERAIVHLSGYTSFELIAVKEYVKVLLKTKKRSKAKELIQQHLPRTADDPIIAAKLKMMLSVATDDDQHAIEVVDSKAFDPEIRILACKCLMNIYKNRRDANELMKYYEIAVELSPKSHKFLEEEEL